LTTSISETLPKQKKTVQRRGCLFIIRRFLKWFVLILLLLIVLGVAYQSITTEQDKRNFSPRGQLFTVNGHQIHIICTGKGSPTVVLQGGLSAESLWWYRVQNQLSRQTQVCAYDRPGLGWSESVSDARDALTITSELHILLQQAGIPAPYVMAGHSYGGIWTRIYAAQYPKEVAGVVLVDSGLVIPAKFASQSEFEDWKRSNDMLQMFLWIAYRTGIVRLSDSSSFSKWGYPSEIVPELAALHSTNRTFDTTYAEEIPVMKSLTEASATAENLGTLPVVILWASETNKMMELVPTLREFHAKISMYSSNSITRVIAGADHGSILGNEQYAQQVTDAILLVIKAVQTSQPLTP